MVARSLVYLEARQRQQRPELVEEGPLPPPAAPLTEGQARQTVANLVQHAGRKLRKRRCAKHTLEAGSKPWLAPCGFAAPRIEAQPQMQPATVPRNSCNDPKADYQGEESGGEQWTEESLWQQPNTLISKTTRKRGRQEARGRRKASEKGRGSGKQRSLTSAMPAFSVRQAEP